MIRKPMDEHNLLLVSSILKKNRVDLLIIIIVLISTMLLRRYSRPFQISICRGNRFTVKTIQEVLTTPSSTSSASRKLCFKKKKFKCNFGEIE